MPIREREKPNLMLVFLVGISTQNQVSALASTLLIIFMGVVYSMLYIRQETGVLLHDAVVLCHH